MMIKITRRVLIAGAIASLMAGPSFAGVKTMTAPEAHEAAKKGEVVFIDVRSPEEWAQTGIATTAHPVSMHKPGFLQKLGKLVGGDKTKAVALICATGSRSGYLRKELKKYGYNNVISVSEGMLGGQRGKGWIPRGLPVKKVPAMAN